MSERNIEIVRRILETWGEEGSPVPSGLLDPEIVWTIRDGRAVCFRWFNDPREALEAAGLADG